MKILGFNHKLKIAKIKIDSLDDLWHLSKIIEQGDMVSGQSSRKVKLADEGERQKAVKKPIFVQIKVESTDLGRQLKVRGSVQNETSDIPLHSYHSLDIDLGTTFEIHKEKWRDFQVQRLKEAEEASSAPKALVCVLDDEHATLAFITASGYKLQGSMNLRLTKKMFEEKQRKPQEDLDKLIEKINNQAKEGIDVVILGSPLFWKEILFKKIQDKYLKLAKKCHLENASSGDEQGIREIVERGALDKITRQSQAAKESKLIENFLEEIAKSSKLVAYKLEGILKIIDTGAISKIMITENKLGDLKEKAYDIIDKVEELGGEVHIISSKSDAGRKLNGLGGIGALLRYTTNT